MKSEYVINEENSNINKDLVALKAQEELERKLAVEAFLAKGGKIEECPPAQVKQKNTANYKSSTT